MSDQYRLHGYKGGVISPGFRTRREAKADLEGRVGRPVSLHCVEAGLWFAIVDGHRYWVRRDGGPGFPGGSGLEHLNERGCPRCHLVHRADQECPW